MSDFDWLKYLSPEVQEKFNRLNELRKNLDDNREEALRLFQELKGYWLRCLSPEAQEKFNRLNELRKNLDDNREEALRLLQELKGHYNKIVKFADECCEALMNPSL